MDMNLELRAKPWDVVCVNNSFTGSHAHSYPHQLPLLVAAEGVHPTWIYGGLRNQLPFTICLAQHRSVLSLDNSIFLGKETLRVRRCKQQEYACLPVCHVFSLNRASYPTVPPSSPSRALRRRRFLTSERSARLFTQLSLCISCAASDCASRSSSSNSA